MRFVIFAFLSIFMFTNVFGDEKINQIRTLQTHGLDFVEKEFRLSSEIFNADKDGQIWIEAEASYLLSFYPNGNIIKTENCSGVGIVDVMSSSYQIKLDQKIKSYEVWVRIKYLKQGDCVINSFVDGDVLNVKGNKITVTEKEINKWVWVKINTVSSQEEFRKLTISGKGSIVLFDKILVSPSDKVNSKLILEASLGGEPIKSDSNYGEWISEKFKPAGVKLWKRVQIKARNNEEKYFKVYFKTRTKDWTVLNKDLSLDQEADYKNGDYIQFKIKFSKKEKDSPIFEKLELVYEENPFVLKSIQNINSDIQVSFINGKIYALTNKVTGKSYIPQDRGVMPFLLYSKGDDGDLVEIDENDFYPSKPEIVDLKNGYLVLKISFKGETSGLKVDYKMTVETNTDIIKSELSLKGKGNVVVAGVDFPRMQNLILSPNWESDHVIFPLSGGLKIDAPAAGAYLNGNYPEECSLPWLDIVGDNGGVFFYYPDYQETKKNVTLKVFHNISMDGIHMAFFHNIEDASKIQLNSVMSLHAKNWHAGADKYKMITEGLNKKNDTKLISDVDCYAQILSPFEDSITESSPEQKILLKYLNVSYLAPSTYADKILNLNNNKANVAVSRLVRLSDLNFQKNSNEIFMLDSFGDNAEVFQFCYPDKKLMGKVFENMSLKTLQEYYKKNWIFNRVIPVYGYEGREMSLLHARIKPFVDPSNQKSKFLDDLCLENYQSEELMLKRYDYNDGDKKIICLLYYHDGKPKNVSLLLNEVGKINNIYHTSIGKSFEEIPFQYVDNQLKFEIPNSDQPFGAILLSMGGAGKEMVYGQLVQDRLTPKLNNLSISLINFSNSLARVKLTLKDKNNNEVIKTVVPELVELKAGETKNIACAITNFNELNFSHDIEVTANNLANGQNLPERDLAKLRARVHSSRALLFNIDAIVALTAIYSQKAPELQLHRHLEAIRLRAELRDELVALLST